MIRKRYFLYPILSIAITGLACIDTDGSITQGLLSTSGCRMMSDAGCKDGNVQSFDSIPVKMQFAADSALIVTGGCSTRYNKTFGKSAMYSTEDTSASNDEYDTLGQLQVQWSDDRTSGQKTGVTILWHDGPTGKEYGASNTEMNISYYGSLIEDGKTIGYDTHTIWAKVKGPITLNNQTSGGTPASIELSGIEIVCLTPVSTDFN